MKKFGSSVFALAFFFALFAFAPAAGYGQKTSPTPASVNIVNTPSVRDADNPARQPFQSELYLGGAASSLNFLEIAQVPAGKRLVIENVAVSGVTPTGQRVFAGLITTMGNFIARHPLLVHAQGINENGEAEFVISQQARIYADPGSNVTIYVRRSSTSGASVVWHATISGYLVDVQ
ncbi:MAG TPA: hypothetical protein VF064_16910 [Pyrinomonadaceae bacterium]